MVAIVELNGQQYRIDDAMKQLRVDYIAGAEAGQAVTFDKVLLADTKVGGKATISATVASHGRDPKIIVFKKRRRKGYRNTHGHRQDFTMLDINEFSI